MTHKKHAFKTVVLLRFHKEAYRIWGGKWKSILNIKHDKNSMTKTAGRFIRLTCIPFRNESNLFGDILYFPQFWTNPFKLSYHINNVFFVTKDHVTKEMFPQKI